MFLAKMMRINYIAKSCVYTASHFKNHCKKQFMTSAIDYCQVPKLEEDQNIDNLQDRFGLSEAEASNVIDRLNCLTKSDLKSLTISNKIATAFLSRREKIDKFTNIQDLLYIDGVGIKQAKKLCNVAQLEIPEEVSPKNDESKFLNLLNRKKLIKPTYTQTKCSNVIAITLNPSYLGWTEILCEERKIVDIQHRSLMEKRRDVSKTHDMVLDAICEIPDADLYVVEYNAAHFNFTKNQSFTAVRINFLVYNSLIRGIALTLLQSKASQGFYYLSEAVPVKLFNLKIGNDRKNSVKTVQSILRNHHEFSWLKPVGSAEFLFDNSYHPSATDSTLLALSFLEAAYEQNRGALELLL